MAILRPSRISALVDQDEPTSEGDVATWDATRASYEPRAPGTSGGGPHASTHQNGGGDEVNVGGLSGLLADAQTPLSHSHASEIAAAVTAHEGLPDPHPTYSTGAEVAAAVTAHEGAANPHSGYATDAEAAAAASAAVATHVAAGDPHSQYTTAAEAATAASAAVTTHEGAANPHSVYQLSSQKGAVNGYAGLGADGIVPAAQLPPPGSGSDPYLARLVLAADKPTGANVTPVTLGLSFAFVANSKYVIDIYALVQPTAATTGCGFMIDVSAAVTYVGTHVTHQLAAAGTLSGATSVGDMAATLSGISSGMPGTAAGGYPVIGGGILITGANAGTATFFFRAEVAAVTTCKAGSMFLVTKVV